MWINASLKTIPYYSFCECTSLKTFELPYATKTIEEGAFSGCTSLTSIFIMNPEFERIDAYAFEGCTALNNVTCRSTKRVPKLGEGVFDRATYRNAVLYVPYQTTVQLYQETEEDWHKFLRIQRIGTDPGPLPGISTAIENARQDSPAATIYSLNGTKEVPGSRTSPESVVIAKKGNSTIKTILRWKAFKSSMDGVDHQITQPPQSTKKGCQIWQPFMLVLSGRLLL